jgi:hypothetical protein
LQVQPFMHWQPNFFSLFAIGTFCCGVHSVLPGSAAPTGAAAHFLLHVHRHTITFRISERPCYQSIRHTHARTRTHAHARARPQTFTNVHTRRHCSPCRRGFERTTFAQPRRRSNGHWHLRSGIRGCLCYIPYSAHSPVPCTCCVVQRGNVQDVGCIFQRAHNWEGVHRSRCGSVQRDAASWHEMGTDWSPGEAQRPGDINRANRQERSRTCNM